MGLQAQNAFNDKALQYTLLPLGIWIAAGAGWATYFPHVLSLLILSPFILFAPIAGCRSMISNRSGWKNPMSSERPRALAVADRSGSPSSAISPKKSPDSSWAR